MVNEYETKKRSYERTIRQIGERKLKVASSVYNHFCKVQKV